MHEFDVPVALEVHERHVRRNDVRVVSSLMACAVNNKGRF